MANCTSPNSDRVDNHSTQEYYYYPAAEPHYSHANQSAPIGRISVNRVATDRKNQQSHTSELDRTHVAHECCWCLTAKESYDHDPIHCKRVNQYDAVSLTKFVDRKNLCWVCLQAGHSGYECNRKRNRCTQCKLPHTELLPHTEVLPL